VKFSRCVGWFEINEVLIAVATWESLALKRRRRRAIDPGTFDVETLVEDLRGMRRK